MKTMLFLTPELPFPAQSGGKLKSLKLLEHLSKNFDVTLCCALKQDDEMHLAAFRKAMPRVRCITDPVAIDRNVTNLARSYITSQPVDIFRTYSRLLREIVAVIAEDFNVIFLDYYGVGQCLPKNYNGTVVYHSHNAYFQHVGALQQNLN
ncbi:MAG: hypothetical protein ACJAYE_002723 [Candidatus Azotimanducaceae bacterium]|jgi:hypothetical protein